MKKTFLALTLEFGSVAVLALSLAVAAICGDAMPLLEPYAPPALHTDYGPSSPGTAATAF